MKWTKDKPKNSGFYWVRGTWRHDLIAYVNVFLGYCQVISGAPLSIEDKSILMWSDKTIQIPED